MSLKNKNLSLFIFAIVGVSVITAGWYFTKNENDKINFSIPDIEGNTIDLKDYRGEVVFLDFMATWCGPCRIAMQDLVEVYNDIGDKFVLISITVDPNHDTVSNLRSWIDYYDANWTHAIDLADPPVIQLFSVSEIPTYIILDRKGEIRFRHSGIVSAQNLKTEILSLVNE